jgi:hypothetical protein
MATGWKDAVMPDTGAPWNIPYVEPADLVRDYPAADEAQALAIAAGLSAASVISQVVSTTKTDTFSASVAVGALSGDVTGLTATITPATNTNKVLVIAQVVVSNSQGNEGTFVTLYRGSTAIAIGDADGSRQRVSAGGLDISTRAVTTATVVFLDSPATTEATTYAVRISHTVNGTATVYVNRANTDADTSRTGRTVSTLAAIEVAA